MAARKFKFISPGVYINEVDESIITPTPPVLGPLIVGRTRKGPAMRPIKVENYQEFVETFGDPVPGPETGDLWRANTPAGPTYASYAAKAWLNSNVSPATIVRVLGEEHDSRDSDGVLAGWKTTQGSKANLTTDYLNSLAASGSMQGGAYGMWIFDSASCAETNDLKNGAGNSATGTLAAIWYCDSGSIMMMSGTSRGQTAAVTGTAVFIKSQGVNNEFKTVLKSYSSGDDGTGIKATATINIAAHVTLDGTVAITDGAGKTVTYTAKGTENLAANQFDGDSGGDSAVAASLVDCINNAAGHNGTIVASTATVDSGQQLTLVQSIAGTAGNTTITLTSLGGNISKTDFSGGTEENSQVFKFNFDPNGGQYVRDIFNTNPVLTNSDVVTSGEVSAMKNKYWLGETFERQLNEKTTSTDSQFGIILPLLSGSVNWSFRRNNYVNPKTGWFFSQDFGANSSFSAPDTTTRLFRFVSRDYGMEGHKIKIAIEDIKASPNPTSPYGSFTVGIYPIGTADKKAKFEALEKYTNCNLNPISENYIARRIGDRYVNWEYSLDKHTHIGQYANQSKYIRVEMNPALDVDFNQASLPFGVSGPVRPPTAHWVSGSGAGFHSGSILTSRHFAKAEGSLPGSSGATSIAAATFETFLTGGQIYGNPLDNKIGGHLFSMGADAAASMIPMSCSFEFPAPSIRSSSVDGPGDGPGADAYFGVSTTKLKTVNTPDAGIGDYLRGLPFDSTVAGRFEELTGLPSYGAEYSWVFSLDDIRINTTTGAGEFVSGSRADGSSATATSSSYKEILNHHDRFWTVMAGGHDGFDVTEAEPLRNSQWTVGTTTKYTNYAWNSVHRALGTVADQDVIEYNLLTAPGITNNDLTDRVMEIAEERADALAIIDLADVFTPSTENTKSFANNLGSVTSVVSSIQNRELNTSYACAYYPWVQIRDTSNRRLLWTPPSVVALGAMGHTEAVSELWKAPAGYKRGTLSRGHGGVPVTAVSDTLNLGQRDELYLNNINPIASLSSDGIVVFGQKTLQATPSALDRINVRRLMIFLKKEVSRMSTQVLFDNNVPATWSRFTSLINPFLSSVKARFGITEYKVILDESTTTPDLVDRNIMYAKIYLKPARAIEFIALDFIITKSGASFED
jgi:hypothetical protein